MNRTVTLDELKRCSTWSVKDNSTRGYKTVDVESVKVGDKVIIENYFTLVVDNENPVDKPQDIELMQYLALNIK